MDEPRPNGKGGIDCYRTTITCSITFAEELPILVERDVKISEVEDSGGVLYACFTDPDGNSWRPQHAERARPPLMSSVTSRDSD